MAPLEKTLVVDLNDKPENQRLLSGRPQTRGMRSGRVYLATNEACGQHSTKDREEILVFLSGRGQLFIAEQDGFEVGQGKIAYIPPNTLHNVKNTGPVPLVYIYCVTPIQEDSEK